MSSSDLHCCSLLEQSGCYLGLSWERLDPELAAMHELSRGFEEETIKLFNLDYPEDFLNLVLDDLCRRAWQNDIRGEMTDA